MDWSSAIFHGLLNVIYKQSIYTTLLLYQILAFTNEKKNKNKQTKNKQKNKKKTKKNKKQKKQQQSLVYA